MSIGRPRGRKRPRKTTSRGNARPLPNPAVERLAQALRSQSFDSWSAEILDASRSAEADARYAMAVDALDSIESQNRRGHDGWLARWIMSELLTEVGPLSLEEGEASELETVLHRVASAMVLADLLSSEQLSLLTAPIARVVDLAQATPRPLDSLRIRLPHPMRSLLRWSKERLGDQSIGIVTARRSRTLQEIGTELGMSRERIRQIQHQAKRISLAVLDDRAPELRRHWEESLRGSFAASEEDLLQPFLGGEDDLTAQLEFGRALLDALGAVPPVPFGQWSVVGWWTLEPDSMVHAASALESLLPCERDDMDRALDQFRPAEAAALRLLLSREWGGFRIHRQTGLWVRSGARDRDASWLLLLERGEPCEADDLAQRLGTNARALREALRRDSRFVQLRPSGLWGLVEWGLVTSPHATVLDASLAVITEFGPVTLPELVRRVRDTYPVTEGAVHQCLNHHLIGRWSDGTIDLVNRGATPIVRREPERSADVSLDHDRVTLSRRVDADLLRGSGLGVPPYLTWALGLTTAPSARTFGVGHMGKIRVKYAIQGSSISSLRIFAEMLHARMGCQLRITLSLADDSAAISVDCHHHDHTGRIP